MGLSSFLAHESNVCMLEIRVNYIQARYCMSKGSVPSIFHAAGSYFVDVDIYCRHVSID
jgi:hypothetical protein